MRVGSLQRACKKSACLHNGFDFSRIQDIAEKKKIRKLFDIRTKYVVGMVASFSNKKDYKTFVDAAHILLEKRRDITFMLIGDGDFLMK
jgi:glycosyltransferase involved in cell wall biosynthesis